MAHVVPHRQADGTAVTNVFDRLATDGDAIRFFSAESGHRQIVQTSDTSLTSDGQPVVTTESGSHLFNLDFQYIVQANQLQVMVPYSATAALFVQIPSVVERNIILSDSNYPGTFLPDVYFEEVGSSSVRVYGLGSYLGGLGVVLFMVPHTAIPADSRNKIVVRDQGDNRALEFLGFGDGVLFRSPDGRRWLMRVDNSGTPVIEPR